MNTIIEEDTLQIINENTVLKSLKDVTFAITGATGMIGSYVMNTLVTLNKYYNSNIKIIALVRDPEKLKKEILEDENITVINYDVINPLEIDKKADYIIHAASPASPVIMKNKPFETNLANTLGTYNTLKYAQRCNAKSYLFISSREIYGEPLENQDMFFEDGMLGFVDPLVPRNGYAEGKKAAENMCVSMKEEYGLNTKIARLAHTYGPGMSIYDGRVQADFLKNAINNENIIMKSDGSSIRTYTYISDAVSALFKILLESKDIVYNVSNEEDEVSIKMLADRIAEIANVKVIMQIDNSNSKGSASFKKGILSSKKIREELNWKPKYNINEGFKRTIEFLKKEN